MGKKKLHLKRRKQSLNAITSFAFWINLSHEYSQAYFFKLLFDDKKAFKNYKTLNKVQLAFN